MPTVQKFIRKIIIAGRDGITTAHAQAVAVLTFLASFGTTRAPSPSSSVSLREGYAPTSFGGRAGPLSGLIVAAEGYDTGAAFSSPSVHVTTFDVLHEPMRWDIGQPLPANFIFSGPAGRLQMGVDGVYRAVALDAPRDNHWVLSKNGQKLRTWLLEGTRTNQLRSSADFTNATAWGSLTDFTSVPVASCIEGQSAARLTNKGTVGSRSLSQDVGTHTGQVCTVSVIVENVDAPVTLVSLYDNTAQTHVALVTYTWATDSIAKTVGGADVVFNREKLPGGRVRISVSGTGTAGNVRRILIYPTGTPLNTNTLILHHAQLEDGYNIPSSPIVTTTGALTRVTEKAQVTWPYAPRSMTVWTDLVDFGSALQGANGVWWHLGNTSKPRILLYPGVPPGRVYYGVPEGDWSVDATGDVRRNEHVLYRVVLRADNGIDLGKVAEGVEELVTSGGHGDPFAPAWSGAQMFLGGYETIVGVRPQTVAAFRSLRARWGEHTLGTIQDRGYRGPGLYVWKAGMAAPAPNALTSNVRTYIDSNGVVRVAGANDARAADYSTGQRGLLVEERRTNVLLNSAFEAGLANWSVSDTPAIVADGVYGTQCVDVLYTGESRWVVQQPMVGAEIMVSLSGWAKGDATIRFGCTNLTSTNRGPVIGVAGGNGLVWRRYTLTDLTGTNGQGMVLAYAPTSGGTMVRYDALQLEVGAFASSFIPTASSAATRAADAVIALQVLPAGIHATRYEKYYDLVTKTVVEKVVDVPSTTGDVVFADTDMSVLNRVWYALAYDVGVKTLAQMQALVASV